MAFFQHAYFTSKVFLLEFDPSSPMDSFIDMSSKLLPWIEFQHYVSLKSLHLITFHKRRFLVSLLGQPIWSLSIHPSPVILTFICDQILSEITNSIIFYIAKEEGLQAGDYNSPVIDTLV